MDLWGWGREVALLCPPIPLKPLSRKVFHASNALIMLYLHTHLSKFQALLALGLAASFIFCGEVLRMQWPQLNSVLAVFLRPIMRQSEVTDQALLSPF